VHITGDNLRLDRPTWRPFWAAMIHAVRNAVDHGIEPPEERRLAGKPEAGVVELSAQRHGNRIVLAIRDDGRGIDWERVRARAAEQGLPCAGHADLIRALFVDGFTTRDAAGELSGRGVGLSALRQAVQELDGEIDVESTPGTGTTFRFSFEDSRMIAASGPTTPRPHRTSLLPFLS